MFWNIIDPWWVALGLGLLLILTLRLIRAHVAGKFLLLIGALIALAISAYLGWLNFGYSPALLLAWLMGVALALLINDFIFAAPRGVFYVANKSRFIFPGSVWPFMLALGLVVLYYGIKWGQNEVMPWSSWAYLNYIAAALYGFLGGMFVALFLETLRAQKERPIGQRVYGSTEDKVYWTVAK